MNDQDPKRPIPAAEGSRRELLAIAFGWLGIVNLLLGAVLWLRPGRLVVDDAAPGVGSSSAAATPTFDMKTYVAAPPVAGRPTAEALDAAIRRGTEAFLHLYVEPSLERCENGGWLDYVGADGSTTRLGPNVFVQCHLYLIVHLLMYQEELGIARDHPLVQRALRFLLSTFDDAQGRWLWSEEGCLQSKGLIALAQFGEKERFEKGWSWALASPMHLQEAGADQGLFTMMQSGSIIQTLGPATRSLSGQHAWDHGTPIPDEENGAKFLFALLAAGRTPDDPETSALARRLSAFLAANRLPIGAMNTRHIVGRAWLVHEYARWRFPPDDGYRIALAQLRAAGRGEWRINLMLRLLPAFRSEVLRALLEAGERSDELDAIANGFVAAQDPDGAWRAPQLATMWDFEHPPKQGYRFGNMDGANTYMVTLGLIAWRALVSKG